MGWVSCLEDAQTRLDNILNSVQGLETEIGSSTWYELNKINQLLEDLQNQLDEILEAVTDPNISPKIELCELKKDYELMKSQNHGLQLDLTEEQLRNLENSEILKETNFQLTEMAKSLKVEQDISEHLTAKYENLEAMYYEERNRREKAESELKELKFEKINSANNLSKKKTSKR